MKTIITIYVTGTVFLLFAFTDLCAQNIFTVTVEGNLEKVKTLIYTDTKLLQAIDELGNTPLHIAIANQKDNIAKYLIDTGSDVNSKSNSGETPLHVAAKMRNSNLAALLISKGALIDVTDASGYTPLSNAIQHHATIDIESRKLETVKILLENGADINKRGMWNWTPLQIAAEFAPEEIVHYLLDNGADIPIEPGQDSYQVLFASCRRGLTNLFEKLIEKGFDLQVNRYTNGLIHSASAGGSEKIVETLLSKGFKVMTGDGYGWSPLHSAAEKGNFKVAELLVSKGADINDRNASGRTPYNLADYFGNKEVCDFLKTKGADTSEQQFPVLEGKYLGQKEPGMEAKVFAPDIVTTKYSLHGNIVFTPDGNEAFWSGWYPSKNSTEEKQQILTTRLEDGKWCKPELASFSEIGFDDDCPYVSPDGNKLFFLSKRPLKPGEENSTKENIWYLTRENNGWSNPKPIEAVNSLNLHWQLSVDKKGNLYFGARDPEGTNFGEIFCSRFVNENYTTPEKLGVSINSENSEGQPNISPEGDFLLFDRASRQGHQMGIFISFLKSDGSWTEAKPIADTAKINPVCQCCYVTHDRKYLFYISGYSNEWGSFWVSTDFIDKMRPRD